MRPIHISPSTQFTSIHALAAALDVRTVQELASALSDKVPIAVNPNGLLVTFACTGRDVDPAAMSADIPVDALERRYGVCRAVHVTPRHVLSFSVDVTPRHVLSFPVDVTPCYVLSCPVDVTPRHVLSFPVDAASLFWALRQPWISE